MAIELKLPELGENITSGRVVNVLVEEGQKVEKDQSLFELETDKAVVEVPAESAGVIKKILVKEGEEVQVGQTLLVVEDGDAEKTPAEEAVEPPATEAKQTEPAAPTQPTSQQREVRLPELGENVTEASVARVIVQKGQRINAEDSILEMETDKAVAEIPAGVAGVVEEIHIKEGDRVKVGDLLLTLKAEAGPTGAPEKAEAPMEAAEPASLKEEEAPVDREPTIMIEKEQTAVSQGEPAPAAPSVRRFAREIGIDIRKVPGTGPGGRISIEDVKAYSKLLNKQRALTSGAVTGVQAEPLPDFRKWGEIEEQPMNKVRETTARHLSYAWSTIPHVTQFDRADITELENMRKKYAPLVEKAGGKLTITAILLKVIAGALKKFPQFNASIDLSRNTIIFKKYYHIGVAVDTDRGLLVPVIRDVDRKTITELAVELADVSRRAREKKLTLEEMQGGNFSISNLGGIGGTGFTPVVNAPEVAILGVSRSSLEPVFKEGGFVPRLMLPLSLSYDHRLIDGADAARFLRWVCEALEQPFLLNL